MWEASEFAIGYQETFLRDSVQRHETRYHSTAMLPTTDEAGGHAESTAAAHREWSWDVAQQAGACLTGTRLWI